MINAAGIGSGLDVNAIISQLMKVEQQPLTSLQKKQATLQTQISAYGKLRSALDTFNTDMGKLNAASKFELYGATTGTATVLGATANSSAKAGSYNVTVNNLAQSHKMSSAQVASTATFGGTDVADALNFTVGSNSFSVNIHNGGAGMTLAQIRDAINAEATNTSVSVTVVTGNAGIQQLVLNSKTSGYNDRIQLGYSGSVTGATLGLADANVNANGNPLASLTQLDASFSVDGMAITRSTNSVSDVVSGVTLDLKAAGSSTLTVARDNTAVTAAIKGMVDSYNGLQKTINTLKAGDLKGDSTLNGIVSRVRSELNTATVSGTYKTLSEVGILTNRYDGTLEVNSATLDKALANDFSGVASLFGNATDGVAMRLKNVATEMLQSSNGLLASRTDGLNSRVKDNQAQQDRMQNRLDMVEKGYRRQFTALDTFMSQMNATSSALQNQLASLVLK